jgi:hypothetical protein
VVQFLACLLLILWSCNKDPSRERSQAGDDNATGGPAAVDNILSHHMGSLEELAFCLVGTDNVVKDPALTCIVLHFASAVAQHLPSARCTGLLHIFLQRYSQADELAVGESLGGHEYEIPDTVILVRLPCFSEMYPYIWRVAWLHATRSTSWWPCSLCVELCAVALCFCR